MLRILVVEDSASQREALIELLRERYWIRGVGDALLDALRRARANLHIIITSGIAMIEPRLEGEWLDHERELRAAGADDFIPKPLELERLVQALDRLAHAKHETRHAQRRVRAERSRAMR